ncbi:uncharacterized protein LOC126810987 isoform X2 [Patella vulgata]|uniref:uncharacterized protein LOC126810987 isoform X2 n=1 Tax=Patella vulgata TaxID=6465 RepID=UPI0024A81DAF|nr:uncharacterized protein LOC126810987 isoform X2 [Patella vulgata]
MRVFTDKMAGKPESIFSQLYRLTKNIELGTREIQQKVEDKKRNFQDDDNDKAVQILQEKKSQVKQLKTDANTTLKSLSSGGNNFNQVLTACQTLIENQREELNKIESYLSNYGYVGPVLEKEKDEEGDEEAEDKEETEDIDSISENKKTTASEMINTPPPNTKKSASRTPRMEDFGISNYGLQAISRMAQNKPVTGRDTRVKVTDRDNIMTPTTNHCNQSVPSVFHHDGFTVTPSIMDLSQWPLYTPDSCLPTANCKKNIYDQHANSPSVFATEATDSPLSPVFRTPAFKQMHHKLKESEHHKIPQPSFEQRFDSPVPPVLQTPGMKQIKKGLDDRVEVDNSYISNYNTASITADDDEEPEPPELTMTFQELTELNTIYKYNTTVTEPKEPVSLTQKLGHKIENKTPPVLELLSTRLNKMGIMPDASPCKGDLPPPPPMLFGKYRFSQNQENLPPH